MKRREFIAGLGITAAWPVVARAQQPAKLPTIGFLGASTPAAQSQWTAAFVQRLPQRTGETLWEHCVAHEKSRRVQSQVRAL